MLFGDGLGRVVIAHSFGEGDMASPALVMASEHRDRTGDVPRGKGTECPRQVCEVGG